MLLMNNAKNIPGGPHDLGGQPAGKVNRTEKEVTFWEQRVDAMVNLMRKKGVITDWAQLRAGVEALSESDYEELDYYERWAVSAAEIAINAGLISREQLSERTEKLEAES